MNARLAFYDHIFRLLDEPTVRGVMGLGLGETLPLRSGWQRADRRHPYINHRLSLQPDDPGFGLAIGRYYIDLFDGEDADGTDPGLERITDLHDRVVTLLDQLRFSTEGGEITDARLMLELDDDLPDPDPRVYHWHLRFRVRLYRAAEVATIRARPDIFVAGKIIAFLSGQFPAAFGD